MGALLEPSKHAYEGRAQSSVTKLCFVFSPIFKGVRTFKKNKKKAWHKKMVSIEE